jgi:sirohydrochlorin ferrochelatase
MSKEKTGGHAFPTLFIEPEHGSGYAGMTLRDWFAGMALFHHFVSVNDSAEADKVAVLAYEVADAMLAERARAKGEPRWV